MKQLVREWICAILSRNRALLRIALQQRSKFEGWLKYELAAYAEDKGASNTTIEAAYPNSKERADISFEMKGRTYHIELKTPNTNFPVQGVPKRTRPITRNIDGIIHDAQKLRAYAKHGLVAFAMFPMATGSTEYFKYIERISREADVTIDKTDCQRVPITTDKNDGAGVVVCVFEVP